MSESPLAFSDRVGELAQRWGPLVVYPSREETIDALFGERASSSAHLVRPFSGPSVLRRLRDKRGLGRLAASAGLRTPEILATGSAEDLAGLSVRRPVVLKPAHGGLSLRTSVVVDSAAKLAAILELVRPDEPLILQEHIPGALLSVVVVLERDGDLVARFMERATHTWPVDAGSIRRSLSVAPDERFIDSVACMLGAAGYWGLAQLDFIEGRSERFLLDINPRFYLGLPLALACGVNLAAAWHAVVTGQTTKPLRQYRSGVSYRWLAADVRTALRGSPAALLYRRTGRRAGAMWLRDDPLPGWLLGASVLMSYVVRYRRRARQPMP